MIRKWNKTTALSGLLGALILCALTSCSPIAPVVASENLYVRDTSKGLSDIAPVRGALRPLRLHRDGEEIECSACHDQGFTGELSEEALKDAHSDIKFDHGLNLRCLNCHNPKNSMTYVNHDGSEISSDTPTQLCGKCHGPHYREWTMGIHGRVNGAWYVKSANAKKLECIQCHNPHRPRFQPMTPEGPPTLTRFEDVAKGETTSGQ